MNAAVARLIQQTQQPIRKPWDDVRLIEDMLRRAMIAGNEYDTLVSYFAQREAGENVHESTSIASLENGIG